MTEEIGEGGRKVILSYNSGFGMYTLYDRPQRERAVKRDFDSLGKLILEKLKEYERHGLENVLGVHKRITDSKDCLRAYREMEELQAIDGVERDAREIELKFQRDFLEAFKMLSRDRKCLVAIEDIPKSEKGLVLYLIQEKILKCCG